MLAQSYRLRSSTDFNKTYKFGRSTNAASLYVKCLQTRLPISRVAVVVSKKVSKRAVVRNRNKRRVVEIVREHWSQIKPGFNVIISMKQDVSDSLQQELIKEVLDCLKRAGLMNP